MKTSEINIRDPFVLKGNDTFYMYGTRAFNFGKDVGGFDVYTSDDLVSWSEPTECFNSVKYDMNTRVNWAPEVYKYGGKYYMFATFTQKSGLRGTYCLKADSPMGPFVPHSDSPLTPNEWECLDGTLYVDKTGVPYLVFCREHTRIIDGTVCYIELSQDLKRSVGEPVYLFSGSSPHYIETKPENEHNITDGPFLFESKSGELMMLWSTFVNEKYAQCLVRFEKGKLGTELTHLDPLITDDGGHGMIFEKDGKRFLTFHSPNVKGSEHPVFKEIDI